MDALRFDLLTRTLASTRREVLRHIAPFALALTGSLAALLEAESEAAKRRRKRRQGSDGQREQVHSDKKRKKKKCARVGQPTSKKRKKCCKGLAKDAAGRCAAPTQPPPRCTDCPANQLCMPSGVCQPCTVTCLSGNPDICGEDLQAALDEGGEVSVCPGRYRGNFSVATNASVIGAGDGAAVGANTILQGSGSSVVTIGEGITATLHNVRITGGSNNVGTGIFNRGRLTLTDSTVTENAANGLGGGIYNTGDGTLTITGCAISANTAGGAGGIFNAGKCTIESSSVTQNVVSGSFGGGIMNDGGLYFNAEMTLTNTTVADNIADLGGGIENSEVLTLNSCTLERNSARTQGGGLINWSGTATLNDSTVAQNTAPDGGGIFVREGAVTLYRSVVNENSVNNCTPADAISGCAG
jgi:hypothetical protein